MGAHRNGIATARARWRWWAVSFAVLIGVWFGDLQSAGAADDSFVRLTLARQGEPQAAIVLARAATRAAQFAAADLQWHLREITGGEFVILRDDEPIPAVAIFVGDSAPVRTLGVTPSEFAPQEYLIRFTPSGVILAGRDKPDFGTVQYNQTPTAAELATWPSVWDLQGTMYAVYDFLERHCDVRWFNPTESGTDIIRQSTFTVRGREIRRAPYMRYRKTCYLPWEEYDRYTGLWPNGSIGQQAWEAAAYPQLTKKFSGEELRSAKRGWNQLYRFRHREGGEDCPGNHSLYGYYNRFWAPAPGQESLFEGRREEWFAKGYSGLPPQMCYTNPELIDQVARDACEYFATGKQYPGAQANGEFFAVEPMDNTSFCRCERCQSKLGSRDADSPFFTTGRHSEYFFGFVNEVARRVRQEHPEGKIVALAYASHGAPPENLVLEPNILVQYCFACNRLPFDRPSYNREIELMKAWRTRSGDRPLYMWLYDTFPVEVANSGGFHCFPGFFAHKVGEQFDLIRQLNYRGVFHCGYGQELEAYLTDCLMDNPDLDVDKLSADYFRRMYGPAAEPLQKFYDRAEQIYGDPSRYPAAIATGAEEGHHHQTEEVAWGYLGTGKEMQALGRLVEAGQTAAATALQRQRIQLFRLGTWDYMQRGREQYLARLADVIQKPASVRRVPFTRQSDTQLSQLDWSEALVLSGFRAVTGEPTRRKVLGRMLCTSQALLLQLEERVGQVFSSTSDFDKNDRWQILLSPGFTPDQAVKNLTVSPSGVLQLEGRQVAFRKHVSRANDRWSVTISIPFDRLQLTTGGNFRINLIRRSSREDQWSSADQPMWSPSGTTLVAPTALQTMLLDTAASVVEHSLTDDDVRTLAAKDLVAYWAADAPAHASAEISTGQLINPLLQTSGTFDPNAVRPDSSSDSLASAAIGPALLLDDARQQYIDFGNAAQVNLNGPLTLLAWVRYQPRVESWFPAVIGKGYEATGAYSLHLRPGGTLWFELDAPDGTRHFYNPTDLALAPEQWTLVVATYDQEMMRIYINGREAGTGLRVSTELRTTAEPLRFGWLGAYGHFNGHVREAAVYRRALPVAEVVARYQAGRLSQRRAAASK